MIKEVHLVLKPKQNNEESIKRIVASTLKIPLERIYDIEVVKRSIDARKRPVYRLLTQVYIDESKPKINYLAKYKNVSKGKPVHIIGAGPAGLFAGLKALELGLKPIIFERGKDVKSRRRDLAAINKEQLVNPESNYCFGEGGAGTYSDGKLYTRSKKRGDIQKALETLVSFGADTAILADAHPHIGTNKLPQIITSIREKIIELGGEIQFNSKLTDLSVDNDKISSITINQSNTIEVNHLVLATGHSARDIFELLYNNNILIEFKPFALGVRVEHPQALIDIIQYSCDLETGRGDFLPPSSYKLVSQTKERGVFSFCMCPGGIVAPCATDQEEVVTNGWSPSKRNNPFANSGIVVEVTEKDLKSFDKHGPLKGLRFQQEVEKNCWIAGGKTQHVPAQRMIDFIDNKTSSDLPNSSYIPGLTSANLNEVLPKFVSKALRQAFLNFGKKMKGYLTNEAVLHAPESRTSSPVRIPRDRDTLQHPEIKGLYPCGEGAGYAGGIISAAIDGQKCIEKISEGVKNGS